MTPQDQENLFRRWLEAHMGLMLKVARSCAANPEDQDDLLQEILLQLWRSLPAFRGESKETTWIYRVAFNTALVWQRGELRRRKRHERLLALDTPPPANAHPPDTMAGSELVDRLYEAIRQLPKLDVSLALMHLDGLSYREMAEVLGISENHVGVKLTRIRRQLAQQLKGIINEL